MTGSFSLGTGIAPTLSLSDLGSNVALAAGTRFTFITYLGAWNGGLFKVGGNTIAGEGLFTFGANTYRLDYNARGNSVALITVPSPLLPQHSSPGSAHCLAFVVAAKHKRADCYPGERRAAPGDS